MKIEPIDPDKLEGEELKVYNEIVAIRERNAQRVHEIEQLGGQLDIATARVEHFMAGLVAIGVLTNLQLLEIHKDWELTMRKQTKVFLERIREGHAQMLKAQREAMLAEQGRTEGGLVVPKGTKINGG